MGFGMNRHTWSLIRNCSRVRGGLVEVRWLNNISFLFVLQSFCTYDDYNWDWSLNQLGKACSVIQRDLKVLVMRSPRVFHIGTW
jgi:hypothetical protein